MKPDTLPLSSPRECMLPWDELEQNTAFKSRVSPFQKPGLRYTEPSTLCLFLPRHCTGIRSVIVCFGDAGTELHPHVRSAYLPQCTIAVQSLLLASCAHISQHHYNFSWLPADNYPQNLLFVREKNMVFPTWKGILVIGFCFQ